MTDAEIRKQLSEQVERERRGVVVDSPKDGPPLMLISKHPLRPEMIARLRMEWEATWRGDYAGDMPRLFVIDSGLELFQLIDGEWRKLQ